MFHGTLPPDQMKKHLPFLVYLAGMIPLGYWQNSLRALLGDWLGFAVLIGYLLALRFIGFLLVRLLDLRHKRSVIAHNLSVKNRKKKKI
jgi:UPF0716 family protein affecting phage T7 exclusion